MGAGTRLEEAVGASRVETDERAQADEVARLIQAHARKVTELIERGPAAAHEETPLPEGYAAGR